MNYGFLIRNDRCIGCHACTTACKSENDVPVGVNRTWVKNVERGRFPHVRRHFQVTRCNHCAEPPCVAICPVTAMYQRPDGIVEFDPDRCIGCKACLQACPYDAIYIDPDSGTAAKCHFCAHRVEIGLEPACVVVCPEHAIISGDLDDPSSEISTMLASYEVTVRKPEQGTRPKLFYVDGEESALLPTATERAPASFAWADVEPLHDDPLPSPIRLGEGRFAGDLVRPVYNAQHRVPWHWPVPAYLVTKGIGAGLFVILGLTHLLGLVPFDAPTFLVGGLLSLLFIGLTTALLVYDLERPERFLRVLTRPQWRSWLTRGAYILVAFTLVAGAWWTLELGAHLDWWAPAGAASARPWLLGAGVVLALGAAVYTAFLFGQAEGRDLWQSPLLPIHLLVEAVIAGSAALLVVQVVDPLPDPLPGLARTVFVASLAANLLVILLGEVGMTHASDDAARAAHEIVRGRYSRGFLWGVVVAGHLAPAALLLAGGAAPAAAGGILALAGLYLFERAFVMAPQEIPNS